MGLEVTVRKYERGDEEAIVPLLERALVWPASEIDVPKLDHWHWKYLDNPMGLLFIGLVEDERGLICHSGALPLMIMVGGKSYRGVEGADVCGDKERADEEMILKAIRCKYAQIERHGVDFCFSFPVQDMYYPLMREFDYIDTGLETLHFIHVLQPDKFFKRVRMGFLKMIGYRLLTLGKEKARRSVVESSERFQIEDAVEFGPDIEELSLAAASQFDIIPVRSRERMNWRYADERAGRFDIRIVRSEGKLVGYAVLKTSGTGESRSCEIADMLVRPDYPGAVESIVCDSANHAKAVGAVSLSCRMLDNHPYVSALRRMGFVRLRSPSGAHWIKLTVRNLGKNGDIEDILKKGDIRVHIMMGDTDGI